MSVVTNILTPQVIAAYVILALIVGIVGRNKQIGFWGFFLLSMVATPVLTGFFMIVCRPRRTKSAV